MSQEDLLNQITQLQQQQSLMTAALASILQGIYTGAGSLEGFVYALDPGLQGTLELDLPVTQSEYDSPKP